MANVKDSVAIAAVAIKSVILVFIEVEVMVGGLVYGLGSDPLPPPLSYYDGVMFSSVQEVMAIEVVTAISMIVIILFMWSVVTFCYNVFKLNVGRLLRVRSAATAVHYCRGSNFLLCTCGHCHRTGEGNKQDVNDLFHKCLGLLLCRCFVFDDSK